MYKPNFCAECGARVERARWRLWTSGRFCDACARRFRRGRFARPLSACATLLALGFAAGRLTRDPPPPLTIKYAQGTTTHALLTTTKEDAPNNSDAASAASGAPRYGPDGTAAERPTDPEEIVSVCGARTKKGTPCSRRVRGTGRCWQHRGRSAMLPPAKLIVRE